MNFVVPQNPPAEAVATGSPEESRGWPTWIMPLVLLLSAALSYGHAIGFPFVFDDEEVIVANPHQNLDEWSLSSIPSHPRGFTLWTFAVTRRMVGLDVRVDRATNIAIHFLAALALAGIVRRTLRLDPLRARFEHQADALALTVALLWLVHPLQTESVTFVTQRMESLMGCLFLGSLYALLRGATSARGAGWYLLSLFWLALGLRTKEAICTAPLLLLWYDRVFLSQSWRELLRGRAAYYAGMSVLSLMFLGPLVAFVIHFVDPQLQRGTEAAQTVQESLLQPSDLRRQSGLPDNETPAPQVGVTRWTYLMSQPAVILHYLRLSVLPTSQCLDYAWPPAESLRDTWLPFAIVSALVLAWLVTLLKFPRAGFVAAWFLVNLAPRSSLIPRLDLAVEHRLYLPLAALVIAAVLAGNSLHERLVRRYALLKSHRLWKHAPAILIVLIAVLLGTTTMRRNLDYRSEKALWAATLRVAPHNPRAMTNLGAALAAEGHIDEAIVLHRQAIAQESVLQFDQHAWYNLGYALTLKRDYAGAAQAFARAALLQPGFVEALSNLGNCCRILRRTEMAERCFAEVLRLNPGHVTARLNAVLLCRDRNDSAEATRLLDEAVAVAPGNADVWFQRGVQYLLERQPEEALQCWNRVLSIDPGHCDAHLALAASLAQRNDFDSAIEHLQTAAQVAPDRAGVHNNLANALARAGRLQEAVSSYEQALRLNPQLTAARQNLEQVQRHLARRH